MKRSFLLFFLLLNFSAFSQKTKVENKFAGLEATFNQILKDWHIAGFAVAVVEKNKIIYSKGFGYRDIEKKLPVDSNTLFAIGSCSKAFTAALIGQWVNEGKIDLDKPATSYLPHLKFYDDNMNNLITPRDMLSHRTGLPRHDISWYLFPSESKDSLVRRIQFMEPSAPLRSKWQYNNFMYLSLGAMDEQLSGNTWEADVRQKIFTPLNMRRSNFTIKDLIADRNASLGYGVSKDSIIDKSDYYNIAGMSPAGAINSSVNEMANWVMTWINDGKFNGKEVIPSSFRTEAISSQSIINGALPTKEKPDLFMATYGFAWMISSYKGHYRVEHGGNIDGFSASTSFFPTDSIGIIVLTNQNGSPVPDIVRNLLTDKALGLKYYDWNADMLKASNKNKSAKDTTEKKVTVKENRPSTHALKDYVGNYNNPGYGTISIYLKNDSLFFNSGGKKGWFRHNNFDVFDLIAVDNVHGIDSTDEPMTIVQFYLNAAGNIDNLSVPFEANIKPIEFKRQLDVKEVSADELQKYIGNYDIGGATVKISLKNNKTLYALVPGQPEYELVPVEKDKFAIKILSGYFIEFTVDNKKVVSGLTFVQPNGNFKATKK